MDWTSPSGSRPRDTPDGPRDGAGLVSDPAARDRVLGANDAGPVLSRSTSGSPCFGEGNTNVFLLDSEARRVYRPLTRRGPGPQSCLCTPVWLIQRELRIGHTTLLQTAYPPLPDDVFTIDVDIATVPIFSRVPVTPAGMVPLVGNATDLTRPATERAGCRPARPEFTYRPGHQRFIITIDTVYVEQHLHLDLRGASSPSTAAAASRPPTGHRSPMSGRRRSAYNLVSASGPAGR